MTIVVGLPLFLLLSAASFLAGYMLGKRKRK